MAKKIEMKDCLEQGLAGCIGMRCKPSEVKRWLVDNILENIDREVRVTLNIHGVPGTAKTSLVKSLASTPVRWNGVDYDGFEIIDIPIAQVEEMGDILGFPIEEIRMTKDGDEIWVKAVDSMIAEYLGKGWKTNGEERTIYAPPSWVPKAERPGVLLFDDGNRASQRILKGLMQLVQDYRTISWSIPKGWTIVFTGNPDNRFNQVTSMDTAQLTRMKHITLVPDAFEWSQWANENGIDKRVISFVLKYEEMMIGPRRTNPRTIAEFGRALRRFDNLNDDSRRWMMEAYASLDDDTVNEMASFFQRDSGMVLDPKVILEDYDGTAGPHLAKIMGGKEARIDLVNIMNDRLLIYIASPQYQFEKIHAVNFEKWMTDKNMPKEQAHSVMNRLVRGESPHRMKFFKDNVKLQKMVRDSLGPLI